MVDKIYNLIILGKIVEGY